MDRFLVSVRVRPLQNREKSNPKCQPSWALTQKTLYPKDVDPTRDGSQVYSFDHVFDESTPQEDIYQKVAGQVVEGSVYGVCGTVFAYGQTSSGKTHTMYGTESHPGIIPQAINDLFVCISKQTNRQFILKVSFMEIYNEKIVDLFADEANPSDAHPIKIKEDSQKGVFVSGINEVPVTSPQQIFHLIDAAKHKRHISDTKMNARSSRAHTILRFEIESIRANDPDSPIRWSALNLVDLAGSEKQKDSQSEGVRLREGTHINKSLHILGKVIAKLSAASSDDTRNGRVHIPFRESKLTRILEPSLGSSSRTSVVCTVTPASIHHDETISTLKFGSRAKKISNKSAVNELIQENMSKHQLEKELQTALNEKNSYLSQTLSLKGQIQQQQSEMEANKRNFDTQFKEQEGKLKQAAEKELQLEENLQKHKETVSSLETEVESLKETQNSLQQVVADCKQQIQSLSDSLQQAHEKNGRLEDEYNGKSSLCNQLQENLREKELLVEKNRAQNQQLVQELSEEKKQLSQIQSSLKNTEQEKQNLSTTLKTREEQLSVCTQQLFAVQRYLNGSFPQSLHHFSEKSSTVINTLQNRIINSEKNIQRIIVQYNKLQKDHATVSAHRDSCVEQIRLQSNQIAQLTESLHEEQQSTSKLQAQLAQEKRDYESKLQQGILEKQQLKTHFEEQNSALRTQHDNSLNELENEHSISLENQRKSFEEKISSIHKDHQHQIDTLQQDYATQINSLKEQHLSDLNELKEKYLRELDEQLATQEGKHAQMLNEIKSQHKSMLKQQEEQYSTMATTEISMLKTSHQAAIKALEAQYKEQMDILEASHSQYVSDLKEKLQKADTSTRRTISCLQQDYEELQGLHSLQIQQLEEQYERDILLVSHEYDKNSQQDGKRIHQLCEQHRESERSLHASIQHLRSHYEKRLHAENIQHDEESDAYIQEMYAQTERICQQAEETLQNRERFHLETMEQISFEYESKLQHASTQYQRHTGRLQNQLHLIQKEYTENKKRLRAEIVNIKNECNDQLVLSRERHEEMVQDLSEEHERDVAHYKEQIRNQEQRIEKLRRSNLALQADYESLHESLSKNIAQFEEERTSLLVQLETSKQERKRAVELLHEKQKSKLESLHSQYREHIQKHQEKNSNAEQAMKQKTHDELRRYKEELDTLKMINETLSEEKNTLLTQKSKLADDNMRLKEKVQGAWKSEDSELKESVESLRQKLATLREKYSQLQQESDTTQSDLHENLEQLKKRYRQLNHKYQQLEQTHNSLKDAESRSDETIKTLQEDYQRARQMIEQHEMRSQRFDQVIKEKDQQIQELSLTLTRAEEVRDKIERKLHDIHAQQDADASQYSERSKQMQQLQLKIESLAEENEGIREHARDQERNLQREIRELKSLRKNFEKELSDASKQTKEHQKRIEKLELALKSRKQQVEALQEELEQQADNHESELSFYTNRNQLLSKEVQELQRENRLFKKEHLKASFESSLQKHPKSLKRKRTIVEAYADDENQDPSRTGKPLAEKVNIKVQSSKGQRPPLGILKQ